MSLPVHHSARATLRGLGATETFTLPDASGVILSSCRPVHLERELGRLLDPTAGWKTLHWDRNYLYVADFDTAHGRIPVVVKQFRGDGLRTRWRRRRRGRTARRNWDMARAFIAAGIGTPEPILFVEPHDASRPSFFVTRYMPSAQEARYLLRAVNAGDALPADWLTPAELLETIAVAIRRLHDAGFSHRDLSPGNILLQAPTESAAAPDVVILDLSRTRRGTPGLLRRSRELSRLWISASSRRLDFVNAYWRGHERGLWWKVALYAFAYHAFRWKATLKPPVRRFVLRWRDWIFTPHPNPHIPVPAPTAPSREKMVWDALSDQPYQHAGRRERILIRLRDSRQQARNYFGAVFTIPRVAPRYRALKAGAFQQPVRMAGAGVALAPQPADVERSLDAIAALGVRRVLLRVYPWEPSHAAAETVARELAARGCDVAFSIPQNRAMVTDLRKWEEGVDRLAQACAPYGRAFQVGQAINRSKWGIWTPEEYFRLVETATPILRRHRPDALIVGPAVIDFEFNQLSAALNIPRGRIRFDVVSSLLYVDRRGAPENRQLGFDTVDKVTLLRAIADTSHCGAPRAWITEMNWALKEGPHSPTGRRSAVDEDTQANYLVRYFILALAAGFVERVYWWQILARGYGLIDVTARGFRRRPSFDALATFVREIEGAWSLGPLATPPSALLYRFQRVDDEVVVGWTTDGHAARVQVPGRIVRVIDRDGVLAPVPSGRHVTIGPSPRYFVIDRE